MLIPVNTWLFFDIIHQSSLSIFVILVMGCGFSFTLILSRSICIIAFVSLLVQCIAQLLSIRFYSFRRVAAS